MACCILNSTECLLFSVGHETISSLEVSDDSSGAGVHASVHADSEATTTVKFKSSILKKSPRKDYRSTQQTFGDINL